METHGFEGPAPERRFQADSGIRHRPVEGSQIHVALFSPHHTISFQSSASRFFQPWWHRTRLWPCCLSCSLRCTTAGLLLSSSGLLGVQSASLSPYPLPSQFSFVLAWPARPHCFGSGLHGSPGDAPEFIIGGSVCLNIEASSPSVIKMW